MLESLKNKAIILQTYAGSLGEFTFLGYEHPIQGVSPVFAKLRTCRGDTVFLDVRNVHSWREPTERDQGTREPLCFFSFCGMWIEKEEETGDPPDLDENAFAQ